MSNSFIKLIKLRLRNQLGLSKLSDDSVSTRTHALITMSGYAIALILALAYIVSLVVQLQLENKISEFSPYLFSLLFWVLGIWTILTGLESTIAGADFEQVVVLPFKKWEVSLLNIFSKMFVYIIFSVLMILIGHIALMVISPFPLVNVLPILIFAFIIPAAAFLLSTLLLIVIDALFIIIKVKNVMMKSILALFLFLAPLGYGYAVSDMSSVRSGIVKSSLSPHSFLVSLQTGDWLWYGIISLAVCIGSVAFCYFVQKYFHTIVKMMRRPAKKTTTYDIRNRGYFPALMKKEISHYMSSFTYVVNTILAPLGLIVLALFVLWPISPGLLEREISISPLTISVKSLYYIAFLACTMITTTTSSSFSMEGKNVWIIKSLPISIFDMSIVKGLLNMMLFIPGIVLSMIALLSVFHLSGIEVFGYSVLLVVSLIFITVIGLYINILFPNYEWTDSMTVVKQGLATIIVAILSMIMIGLSATGVIFLGLYGVLMLVIIELSAVAYMVLQIKKMTYL